MTTIYFAPSEFPDVSDFVAPETGKRFLFKLEMEEEQFRITDTVGRTIPFDYSQVEALHQAVYSTNILLQASEVTQEFMLDVVSQLNAGAYVD